MIDSDLIKETLDDLLKIKEEDFNLFYNSYKSLPLTLYSEIERLSVSKSTLFMDLCKKAKLVADSFHKSIK